MSEVVERVARAILAKVPPGYGMNAEEAREYARAALEALREPTEEQLDALLWLNKMWREMNSREVYRTMIDAALTAPDTKPPS
jgi:hypothetical protein